MPAAGPGDGHLLYMHEGTLFATGFDLDRLETKGQPVPVVGSVVANPALNGGAQVAVSAEGTLVYVPGDVTAAANPIDWVTPDGKRALLRAAKADWHNPSFSPDGHKLVVDIDDGNQRDIWVYDGRRDTATQLTFDRGRDEYPIWSPDGKRIVFASDRAKANVCNLYWLNADGSGTATRLTDSPMMEVPNSWHPSGRFLAYTAADVGSTRLHPMILPIHDDAAGGWTAGTPYQFVDTRSSAGFLMFSPDGRWIVYQSNEVGGGANFNVRPFPAPEGRGACRHPAGYFRRGR